MSQPYEGGSRAGKVWYSLGSPRTVRMIFIAMIVYFLIIGGLVLGYARVQTCLADYSDEQATSAKARGEAARVDREINKEYDDLSTSERARLRADQDALLDLVRQLSAGRDIDSSAVQVALAKVEQVNKESFEIGRVNDQARRDLDQKRASADALRTLNPVPGPPSEKC